MASISTSMSSLTMDSKELITAVCYLGNSVAPANTSGADELFPPHGWAEPFLQPCRPLTALRLSDALATPSCDLDVVVEARRLRRTL
jgi:hypothetical protein